MRRDPGRAGAREKAGAQAGEAGWAHPFDPALLVTNIRVLTTSTGFVAVVVTSPADRRAERAARAERADRTLTSFTVHRAGYIDTEIRNMRCEKRGWRRGAARP